MSETRKCADCPAQVQRKRPNAMFPLRCKACKTQLATSRRYRRTGSEATRELLGPEVPLNGISPQEAERRKAQRIATAAAQGVPLYALIERFGCEKSTVYSALRMCGVERVPDDRLPFGVPA